MNNCILEERNWGYLLQRNKPLNIALLICGVNFSGVCVLEWVALLNNVWIDLYLNYNEY